MCGIFGIRNHPDAAQLTQLGLYSLQHRGQESAGILTVDDDGLAHLERAMGLVSEGIHSEQLRVLPGSLAIGHTRYSTAGSSTLDNAQPIVARTRGSHIALAHNGNIVNAVELRRALEDDGAIFSSTMDSEVLLHRLARSSAATPEDRMAEALQGVEGAYSLAICIGDTLLAARDPRGWRPLTIGRLGDAWVIASETCALDIVGATRVRDVEAGEIVRIDATGMTSIFPFERQPLKRCVFEHVYTSLAARSTPPAAHLADAWRRNNPPRAARSSSPCPIRPMAPRSATPKSPGSRTNSRSFAITTSGGPSCSRPRPAAMPRSRSSTTPCAN